MAKRRRFATNAALLEGGAAFIMLRLNVEIET